MKTARRPGRDGLKQDEKLISTDPGHDVIRPDRRGQPLAYDAEHTREGFLAVARSEKRGGQHADEPEKARAYADRRTKKGMDSRQNGCGEGCSRERQIAGLYQLVEFGARHGGLSLALGRSSVYVTPATIRVRSGFHGWKRMEGRIDVIARRPDAALPARVQLVARCTIRSSSGSVDSGRVGLRPAARPLDG